MHILLSSGFLAKIEEKRNCFPAFCSSYAFPLHFVNLTRVIALNISYLLEWRYLPVLRQGHEVSVKELDGLLSLLSVKKRKMEQEEAETNLQLMLSFLHCLRRQKLDELKEVMRLEFIYCDLTCLALLCS